MTVLVVKECPFCKNTSALRIYDQNEIDGLREGESGWSRNPYYAVECDAREGGCGGSGGYAPTEGQAIEKWNRRGE